ncbi:MerR family DNA-binding protein [Pseudoalteromonas sp. T1lg10]|uniref:MerR family DNA-binding protein n=1 Tax=Pseudoalteromonas sp. T1lg10 TaxID=2077093 RepID=UPI001F35A17A|nr:MerR family DNA-binding protein [Pseudoalteromonas sp. T1lg10]
MQLVERKANGYRSYPPEAEVVLKLIVDGQKAGFSLDELRQLLPADMENWQHDSLLGAIRQKLADIEALQVTLAENKKQLMHILSEIESKPEDMDCADNAKRVLAQLGLVERK